MSECVTELVSFNIIQGCPGDNEIFFVANAVGGTGPGLYGWRKWSDIKNCIVAAVKTPYVGVVGRGQTIPTKDPVSGQSILQDDSLKGLGLSNNGEVQMVIAKTLLTNYGSYPDFTYDSTTGTFDISPNVFVNGDGVSVDRNQ